ncbi:hypothetical protein ACOME3_008758 [Neoechinorhynchus agilis]
MRRIYMNHEVLELNEALILKETEAVLLRLTTDESHSDEQHRRVIWGSRRMRLIVYVQHSIEWLVNQIESDINSFQTSSFVEKETKEALASSLQQNKKLAIDFLLLLYVDVRARCFGHATHLYAALLVADDNKKKLSNATLLFQTDVRQCFETISHSLSLANKELKLEFIFGCTIVSFFNRLLIDRIQPIQTVSRRTISLMLKNLQKLNNCIAAIALASKTHNDMVEEPFDQQSTTGECHLQVRKGGPLMPAIEYYTALMNVDCSLILNKIHKYPEIKPSDCVNLIQLSYRSFGSQDPHFNVQQESIKALELISGQNEFSTSF